MKKKRQESTLRRIRIIQELAKEYYEPGNQAKSYKAVWRNKIQPMYGICYMTFLSYIHTSFDEQED